MALGDMKRQLYGKRGELYVFSELLRRGVVPYVPLVDEGGDCLIRREGGGWLELQVKAINTPSTPRFWTVGDVPDREDYFLVLLEPEPFDGARSWILPGRVARPHVTAGALDLNATPRSGSVPRAQTLAGYRGAWHLLVSPAAKEEIK